MYYSVTYFLILVIYFFMRVSRDFMIATLLNPRYTSIAKLISFGMSFLSGIPVLLSNHYASKWVLFCAVGIINILLVSSDLLSVSHPYISAFCYYGMCDLFISICVPLFWKIFFLNNDKNTPMYKNIFQYAQLGVSCGVGLSVLYFKISLAKSVYIFIISVLLLYVVARYLDYGSVQPKTHDVSIKGEDKFTIGIPTFTVLTGILGGFINNSFKLVCFLYIDKNPIKFIYVLVLMWVLQSVLNWIWISLYGPKKLRICIYLIPVALTSIFFNNIWCAGLNVITFKILKCLITPRKEYLISQNINNQAILLRESLVSRVGKFMTGIFLSCLIGIATETYLAICGICVAICSVLWFILATWIDYN